MSELGTQTLSLWRLLLLDYGDFICIGLTSFKIDKGNVKVGLEFLAELSDYKQEGNMAYFCKT